ncbi:MAG TPA: TlpA disulfide reductase family protein [Saprospiraceae bacterium]|nr:TlpA disulfide reductase family protein [Saprospiraceae bacterium]
MNESKNLFTPLNRFVFFLCLFIANCKAQPQNQITGQIQLHAGWKPVIYLIQPRHFSEISADYLGQVIDSADIDKNGAFAFEHIQITEEKTILQLAVQKTGTRFSNHLIDTDPSNANYMPFVLSKDHPVTLTADISAFQKTFAFTNASTENRVILSLRDIRLNAFEKYVANEFYESSDDTLLIEKEKAHLSYIKSMMDFADSTQTFEAVMISVRWISPTNDFERIPEFIHHQCQKWQKEKPDHPILKELCAIADKHVLPVMTGDFIPDFPLPLASGDTVLLYKLLGRKLTIIDVWASWCAPCRKENRMVLGQLWSAYKEIGLQIIGYSIDNDVSSWKSAIKTDHANWEQASHLSGDVTPFLQTLRITTIPANFIIDSNGKIISKNLHGKDLIEFVHRSLD